LLIAQHLAVVGTGVCFVAPSHSLCREVRDGLDRRLWVLRKFVAEDGPLGDLNHAHASVVVMTPEKLAARLRADEQALLNEFGLFVLDEAHVIDDDTRGWTLETMISRLHSLTKEADHRLFLISAALGGTASVQTWLGIGHAGAATTASWRGPRRLHATYTSYEDTNSDAVLPLQPRQRVPRIATDLYGIVDFVRR
jgi:replicative superfamily II helicase